MFYASLLNPTKHSTRVAYNSLWRRHNESQVNQEKHRLFKNKQRILAPEYSNIVLICVTKVIDGLRLGDWRAVCERAVGFGDKGQVLVVLGLECRLAPFSHLKPTLVVVGLVCTHAHTDKHTRTRAGTHRMATIIRPRGSHTGAEHYTEKSRCGRRIFVIISQYGGVGGVGAHIYETRCWVWRAGQCDTTQSHCHSSTFSY